jgi:hypothetical protein
MVQSLGSHGNTQLKISGYVKNLIRLFDLKGQPGKVHIFEKSAIYKIGPS